jgi:hypothetical protein
MSRRRRPLFVSLLARLHSRICDRNFSQKHFWREHDPVIVKGRVGETLLREIQSIPPLA